MLMAIKYMRFLKDLRQQYLVSHEYDHLNGILHIDLSDDVREMTWVETKTYREEHPYEVLSKDDEFDYSSRKKRIKKTI